RPLASSGLISTMSPALPQFARNQSVGIRQIGGERAGDHMDSDAGLLAPISQIRRHVGHMELADLVRSSGNPYGAVGVIVIQPDIPAVLLRGANIVDIDGESKDPSFVGNEDRGRAQRMVSNNGVLVGRNVGDPNVGWMIDVMGNGPFHAS